MKFIFVALFILLVMPIYTYAETYITNINGIEITKEEYDNFLKVKPYEYIMTMTEENYNKLKSLDYSNVMSNTKYIETVYNAKLKLTTEKEITEEAFESNVMPILDTDTTYAETIHKSITLTVAGGSYWNYVTFTAHWKGIPSVRSFDVIGIRVDGASVRNGSQQGKQIYSENGVFTDIDYAWNGTNIKRLSNGFGISMNVVNNANLESLVMTIDCDITPTKNYAYIFGAYEHAVTNVSLEESQNYNMDYSNGLGNVFVYPFETSQKYDGMSGIHLFYDL